MAALTITDNVANGLQPISGVVTSQQVSKDIAITSDGSLHLRVDVVVSGVTVVGSIGLKLQQRTIGQAYADMSSTNAAATVSANGVYSMTMLVERSGDQGDMPLKSQVCVAATTTNAGDAVTISHIYVQQAP